MHDETFPRTGDEKIKAEVQRASALRFVLRSAFRGRIIQLRFRIAKDGVDVRTDGKDGGNRHEKDDAEQNCVFGKVLPFIV
jgi:hypothetical protein